MKTYKPLHQRFLDKIAVDPATGCWLWQARLDASGYGRFNRGPGLSPLAHRYAYEQYVGPIPTGRQLDHLCRTRRCVNPQHLEVVTPIANVMRGESFSAVNAAKETCVNGHPFDLLNTSFRSDRPGTRECRECAREAKRAYKRRQREARQAV
ncbi:MAG: HNH endonuclease signature motif containing protein [Thermoleophilaceae bacterium]